MDSQPPKPHVLFVDDEPNLLSGLKRSLRGQRSAREISFAGSGIPHWEAELQVMGAPYCWLGGYLMGLWGLPETIVEAVAYMHWPEMAPTQSFSTLTGVHVADALLQNHQRLNQVYLAVIGKEHKLPVWLVLADPILNGHTS